MVSIALRSSLRKLYQNILYLDKNLSYLVVNYLFLWERDLNLMKTWGLMLIL
jgi:hypothetical protein